jgi:alpha-tubulin suppressor-like RCC1 family protein
LIKKISCGELYSLLLTRDGDIYAFGDNRNGQLGIYTPDKKQIIPIKLEISNKFIEIASHCAYNISIALSENNIYYVWGKCEEENVDDPQETEFKSVNDIFIHYFGITYKTLNIDSEMKSLIDREKMQHKYQIKDKTVNMNSSRYESNFKQSERIGGGSFGEVYKAMNLLDEQQYAMKIISFESIL